MTKDEALKLALEAFDSMIGRKPERVEQAITAIKEALAQRTWVGLTDEEVDHFHNWKDCTWSTNELVRHVEDKLKDKNAGR